MTYARTKGIPFIEGNTANFIYNNPASIVNIAGDFNGWDYSTISMSNISGTNFFYYSKEFESDARLDYKFVVNSSQWILDPENPNRVSGGFGPNSELAMPDYVQPWEIKYNPSISHGTRVITSISSNIINRNYSLSIYLPPGYDSLSSTNYPTVYFQDGGEYISLGSAINVLDNLIDSDKIASVIGVFVTPNNRNEEYALNKRYEYAEFFVTELVPFIDSSYNTILEASKRLVLGDSYGGNISALISYEYAEIFGNCGLHSAAFQPNDYEVYNMIVNGENKVIKYSSIWGTYEGLDENMRNFRDEMIDKGYEFDWLELPEGHSWGLWRANIDTILKFIFPPNPTSVKNYLKMIDNFEVSQNYPNPFNPTTTIKYSIPSTVISNERSDVRNLRDFSSQVYPPGRAPRNDNVHVTLKVYDVLGREVAILVNKKQPAGSYEVEFYGVNLASGVYYYRFTTENFAETKKMIFIK